MNSIMENFVTQALANDTTGSFIIDNSPIGEGRRWFFTQLTLGAARLIYGDYALCAEGEVPHFYDGLRLKAVVADGTVYLFDKYLFNVPYLGGDHDIPDHLVFADDARAEMEQSAIDKLFPAWLETLAPADVKETDEIRCHRAARSFVLFGTPYEEPEIAEVVLTMDDFVTVLCGFTTAEDVVDAYLHKEDTEKYFAYLKRQRLATEALIDKPTLVEDYERALSTALITTDAVNLLVEFAHDGKRAAEKMERAHLIRIIVESDRVHASDFVTGVAGDRLFKELFGADFNCFSRLSTAEITKITYGKKTIYEN
jgi:hypothetical protein